MTKLIALVGTTKKESTNRTLLQFIANHFADQAEIELVEIKGIPAFYKSIAEDIPEQVIEIANKIYDADGLIIGTPEYNHAIPAALQNTLEWLSVGKKPIRNKPVLICGASYGRLGSSRAQLQLRQILDAPPLRGIVLPGSGFLLPFSREAFNYNGYLLDDKKVEELEFIFKNYIEFVDVIKDMPEPIIVDRNESETYSWQHK